MTKEEFNKGRIFVNNKPLKIEHGIHLQKIPLHIWILLKFKRPVINTDVFFQGNDKYESIVSAKYLFGKIYIMKEKLYINNVLVRDVRLKRTDDRFYGLRYSFSCIDDFEKYHKDI